MHTAPRSLESCELVSMDSCVFHSVQCKMSEANTGCCARGCVARCAVPKCQEGGRPVLCCSRRRSRRTLRPYSLYAKMGRRRPDPNPSVSTLDDYVCVHNTLPPPPASTRATQTLLGIPMPQSAKNATTNIRVGRPTAVHWSWQALASHQVHAPPR
jgi:hypothetical protein